MRKKSILESYKYVPDWQVSFVSFFHGRIIEKD